MYEVMPAVADTLVDAGDNLLCLAAFRAPTERTSLLEGEFTLRFGEGFLILTEEARVGNELRIVCDGEVVETDINTDLLSGEWKRFCFDLDREADEPLARHPPSRAGFYPAVEGPMKSGLHGSDFAQANSLPFNLETSLGIGYAVVLSSAFEARIAWFRVPACGCGLNPSKESVEGQPNTFRHILQNLREDSGKFWMCLFPCRQALLLVVAGRSLAINFIVVFALVQEAVV